VRTHIQHLMYKLHVHKRAEAVKVGRKLELI
jgi:DNA-binding NarL/FixJ family response regulator